MRILTCLVPLISFAASCSPEGKDGEDTSEPQVYEVPCGEWAEQVEVGVLEIEIAQVESAYPELGDCCSRWDGLWSADLRWGEPGKIYRAPIEYDLDAGVLRAAFDGEVLSCELTLWRDDGS